MKRSKVVHVIEWLVLLVAFVAAVDWLTKASLADIKELGTTLLGCAALAGILFLALYTLLARWWASREGWYLFVSSGILATILTYNYAAIQGWFSLADPAVREWTRLAIYAGALLIMLWRGLLLIQAQAEMWRVRKAQQMDASTKPKDN